MKAISNWFTRGAEVVVAAMLAAMFATFLAQIFSRYVLQAPFGWTLELCLILWVWIVFLGNAFVVRDVDHVTFDIAYLAVPSGVRRVLALISAASIVVGMLYAFLPTWDYIDWMKMRKTTTVKNPFTGTKIPMRTIFSVYAVFMVAVTVRYAWRFVDVLRNGPHDEEHAYPIHVTEEQEYHGGDDKE
ncbi:TRAP transporter small permease [Tropicimonas marinistellae]|uniref:TRAP transporter small permease n=1 Tax=Tropicimonas marinistellae TaxID=1739787 RepID=UPI000835D63C|nr:TRAP transporter small permease [Tropicimonas marinistellae]